MKCSYVKVELDACKRNKINSSFMSRVIIIQIIFKITAIKIVIEIYIQHLSISKRRWTHIFALSNLNSPEDSRNPLTEILYRSQ